jgi:hypothetical protein
LAAVSTTTSVLLGQHAVLRDERLQHRQDGGRIGVAERQDARHHLVAEPASRFARLAYRDDLHEPSARHGREALHLEDRLEDEVRLVGRDEVERDGRVVVRAAGDGGEQEHEGEDGGRASHRSSYTSVRGASARMTSRATRGSRLRCARNPSSAAGSATA